jgi:peptidoglycan/xylan/chitin deacetylase (PgdA/CDA1 family)
MIRKLTLTLALAALTAAALPSCKKVQLPFGNKAATPAPGTAAAGVATPPPPDAPDLVPPAPPSAPETAAATAVAAGSAVPTATASAAAAPAKPPVDTSASVMALCYHNIEDKGGQKSLTITTAEFERQLQAIKDAGFSVIGMQDFLAWRRGEKSIPAKSCLITIDDGWLSGYTNAWPILKKFNYPFTMFIYVNFVGTGGKSLTWDQLAEMRDGGVDIQSHSYSHANLRAPDKSPLDARNMALIRKDLQTLGKEGWLRKEIVESKKVLEERLGIRVNAFAYPFGNWTEEARAVVKEAGYEAAFTVYGQRLPHNAPFDLLGRYAVETGKPAIFTNALSMVGGGVAASEPSAAPGTASQLAASSMVTQPMDGETINNPKPLIKANLATVPGEINPASVQVRLSGVGAVAAKYDPATKTLTAPITQPLKPGDYSVILSAEAGGQKMETRWGFKFAPGAKPASPMDAPLPPPPTRP